MEPSHKPHTVTHFQIGSLSEKMIIIINWKSHRSQDWLETCPIGMEMTLAKWLLHTLWGPAMTKASRATVHPSSHTSAGLIEHPITDRWMSRLWNAPLVSLLIGWQDMWFCGGRRAWDNLALVADSSGASVRLKGYLRKMLLERKPS